MTPPQRIAHYRIAAKIGEGGMGAVFRATDTKLGRDVAIKILPDAFANDADRLARFTREAQVLASLNHPNIAAIYGVEERSLIMELVDGPTLAERIAEGAIPLEEALPIARQIAEALEYAHEKSIIHRDLKPTNIKLTPEGKVKVLDFGLAKALANDAVSSDPRSSPTLTMRATMAGVIMGTAAYMSPEQARGAAVDRRSDIWSFGVVLYEMLTARQMFGGDTVSDSLAAVLKTDVDWSALPAQTPPCIRRLLRRCLERDRKRRLSDIGDARLEIDEGLSASPEPAVSAAPAPPKPPQLWRWLIPTAAAIAAAGILVAAIYYRETRPEPETVRFQFAPPEKNEFGNGGMALSPDGRRLAFIASGPDGRTMLWVRSLDSLESRPLHGTEGAAFLPFWSPDSRFIGFGVMNKLKKVEASGGPPQTLCEIAGSPILGGSWNRDGVIIFGYNAEGLFRVPQAGGVATMFTTIDKAHGELGHMRPWFFPDGQHFIYVTRMVKAEDSALYLASLDGKPRKRLVGTQQAGAYANGHLLFLREGTLMAQAMDPRRFEFTGEPFPVAEQVGAVLALGFFSVSSNGVLAYRSGSVGGFGFSLTWFDRTGKSEGILGPTANYAGGLALSPDGRHVAVDETDSTGNRDIWLLDVARGVPTRFTFDPARDQYPVWSPDGSRLFFSSDRGMVDRFAVYHKASSGSGTDQLVYKSDLPILAGTWSPDGRQLVYQAFDPKTQWDLWVLPVNPAGMPDGNPVPYLQTPFGEYQAQFSPDGHWIAYTSDESGLSQQQVFVQSFPGGAGKFQISTGQGGAQPRWGRDGKEIFYIATDGKLMAVEVKTSPRFEAGAPAVLFDPHGQPLTTPTPAFRYDVTADGKRFLVNTLVNTSGAPASAPITVVLNWHPKN